MNIKCFACKTFAQTFHSLTIQWDNRQRFQIRILKQTDVDACNCELNTERDFGRENKQMIKKLTMMDFRQLPYNVDTLRETSRSVVGGTPSSSLSRRVFFRATKRPETLSRALYTFPYVPSPTFSSFSYLSMAMEIYLSFSIHSLCDLTREYLRS